MRSSKLACKGLCLFAFLLFTLAGEAQRAVDPATLPKPTGYVTDLANVVNGDSKAKLEAFCTRVESELGVQFAFVTIDTIGDADIRDFALKVFRTWGVGDRKTNQGVLLLLATKDRKSDLETGRGIEPYLTDGFSGSTLRAMRPDLRSGNYGAALLSAAHAMARQIAQGKNIAFSDQDAPPDLGPRKEEDRQPARSGRRGGGWPLFVLGSSFCFGCSEEEDAAVAGGGGGSFFTGMLLGNLLGGGRSRDWDGGGGWGSGGGFGGGDSGGGGGFGGFGGGDAGGGGASSDW